MNWNTKSEDNLDNLPRQERFPDQSRDRYRGWNFPYRRMMRWLESKVGTHVDQVTHEYVNADWIPAEFRQGHHLAKYLEIHTFMLDGKICYYDSYTCFSLAGAPFRIVEAETVRTFYVHPVTRLVCIFVPETRKSYRKLEQERKAAVMRVLGDYHQLYKENGIWYEVKAKPLPAYYSINHVPFNQERKGPHDMLLAKNHFSVNNVLERGNTYPYVKIILKRQLNHKELAKYGLHNEPVIKAQCKVCGKRGCELRHKI